MILDEVISNRKTHSYFGGRICQPVTRQGVFPLRKLAGTLRSSQKELLFIPEYHDSNTH